MHVQIYTIMYSTRNEVNESKPFINSSVDVKSVPAAFLAVQLYVPLSFPRKLFNVSKENESVLSIRIRSLLANLDPFLDHSNQIGTEPEIKLQVKL